MYPESLLSFIPTIWKLWFGFSGECHGYIAFIICLYRTDFVYRTLFFSENEWMPDMMLL